jgi:hypothetical protein
MLKPVAHVTFKKRLYAVFTELYSCFEQPVDIGLITGAQLHSRSTAMGKIISQWL